MKKVRRETTEAAELRRRAEALLHAKTADVRPPWTEAESLRLRHELEVHQVELEMQNAELRKNRDELETVLAKYTDLYDFAPMGYFTIDREGIIRNVNFTGASLLGFERSRLLGKCFSHFLTAAARPSFATLIEKVFARPTKETYEVAFNNNGMRPWYAQIEAQTSVSAVECRIAVIDISTHRDAEEELRNSREEFRNLSQHLQNIREEQSGTISREIYEELGQLLTALKMEILWLGSKLPKGQYNLLKKTRGISFHIDESIKMIQRISAELRPVILDDLGLTAAIEWQADEFLKLSGITCKIKSSIDLLAMNSTLSTTLFRIFQESLANIFRHTQATEVCVTLDVEGVELVMTEIDNGNGIDEKNISDPRALNLIGMRERVHHFGGEISISRIQGGGTCVRVNIPLTGKQAEKITNGQLLHPAKLA